MNGISMNMKCACGAYHVAGTAAFAISKSVFDFAGPFGSAFFLPAFVIPGETRNSLVKRWRIRSAMTLRRFVLNVVKDPRLLT